jgi:hypothetical protein
MTTPRSVALVATVVAFGLLPAPTADAQVVTIDEGAFIISRRNQQIGREEFSIRRPPPRSDGVTYVASATVVYDDRRLAPALSTDSFGTTLAYQLERRRGTETEERLSGSVGRARFTARSLTQRGESAREYVVGDGALVLDEDVFHQYYFLALANRIGPVAVIEPRKNSQATMRVQSVGEEPLVIGGTSLRARHLVLTSATQPERHVWVDANNRVLKVSIPEQGILAIREEPPR